MRIWMVVPVLGLILGSGLASASFQNEVARCAGFGTTSQDLEVSDVRIYREGNGEFRIEAFQIGFGNNPTEMVVLENAGLVGPHVIKPGVAGDIEQPELRDDSHVFGSEKRGMQISIGYHFPNASLSNLLKSNVFQAEVKGSEINNGQPVILACEFDDTKVLPSRLEDNGLSNLLKHYRNTARILK